MCALHGVHMVFHHNLWVFGFSKGVVNKVVHLDRVLDRWSMKVRACILISSTASLSYSEIRFLGSLSKYWIMKIFDPDSIHSGFFALTNIFLLNKFLGCGVE